MASIYDLKPRFQGILRPVLGGLARRRVTPNAITLSAIAGSIAAGVGVAFANRAPALLLILPAWLFVRMALNALDGMMAREFHMASRLGTVLNELGDVVSDLAIYLALVFVCAPARGALVVFSIGAVLSEMCGVLGLALGSTRRYEGPMGKSDRAFLVGALGLVTCFVPRAFAIWPWVFALGAVLTAATCANRVRAALRDGSSAPPSS